MVVENIGKERFKPAGVRDALQSCDVGGTSLWIGDVGDYPPYYSGPCRDFITGCPHRLLGGIHGGFWTEFGINPIVGGNAGGGV